MQISQPAVADEETVLHQQDHVPNEVTMSDFNVHTCWNVLVFKVRKRCYDTLLRCCLWQVCHLHSICLKGSTDQ